MIRDGVRVIGAASLLLVGLGASVSAGCADVAATDPSGHIDPVGRWTLEATLLDNSCPSLASITELSVDVTQVNGQYVLRTITPALAGGTGTVTCDDLHCKLSFDWSGTGVQSQWADEAVTATFQLSADMSDPGSVSGDGSIVISGETHACSAGLNIAGSIQPLLAHN